MLVRGLFRYQQCEDEADGLCIGCVEGNGRGKPDECAKGIFQAFAPAMGNRDPMPETGGTKPFTNEEAIEYHAACNALIILEQHPETFEQTLLARHADIDLDVGRR